jgi:hypothetical protein
MKALKLVSAALLALLFANSCCSKKGACPAIQFDNIQLVNFRPEDVSDSVTFIVYDGTSNFGKVKDSGYVKVERSSADTNVYRFGTGNMKVDDDYAVRVTKLNKLYRISNFSGSKIACGKCFLRNNNQYGYVLTGYRVNNNYFEYEDGIVIMK